MRPFKTAPLPQMGMDGEIPYEGQYQELGRPGGGGGGDVAGGATSLLSPESKEDAAAAMDLGDMEPRMRSYPPENPRIEILGRSSERRDLCKPDGGRQDGGQPTGSGGVGGGDQDNAAAPAGASDGLASAQGKEPMQKSTSLTAKVFASGSGMRSSAASTARSARSSAASVTGTSFSGSAAGGGNGNASPDTLSPTSTSADALPSRGMGRRQGDSTLQKLFRKKDEGPGESSSQPTSPSSRPAPAKESGGSSRSLLSGPTATAAVPPAAVMPSASAASTPPDHSVAAAAAAVTSSNSVKSSATSHGGGSKSRDSPLGGSKHGNAAPVMPRPSQRWAVDPDGSSDGGGGNGSTSRKRTHAGFAPVTTGDQPADGAPEEKVEQQLCEGGTNDRSGAGICKDGSAPAAPKCVCVCWRTRGTQFGTAVGRLCVCVW